MSRGVLEREERGTQATVRREVSAYMHTVVATAPAGRLSGAPHKHVCMRVSRWVWFLFSRQVGEDIHHSKQKPTAAI
nr:hypothetical protein [Candidatus Njordarchaeota archaeon]